MKRLNVLQGSPEWKALRAKYPCASEAPVIMGASRHMTRGELLRLKAAGMEREFSDYVQRMVLDKGHEVEAPAREITQRQLGEALYPITAVDDADEYLASLDGCTMAEDWLMEHKQWNEELAAAIRAGATKFPDGQEWQLEQQLLVASDAEGVIFVCSDGTEERRVQMEYRRVPGRAEQLRAGWKQFFHDLEHGDHTPAPPKAVAAPMELLPAVTMRMQGAVQVVSNLAEVEPLLRAFIERMPAKPSTDQEFATTEAACKALKKLEEELDRSEDSTLASLSEVEAMRRMKAMLHKLARDTRLQREKLVDARKLEIRTEEIKRGRDALATHVSTLNAAIGKPYMPAIPNDFAAKIKGLRTVQSVRDAIDQHLTDSKLAADEAFRRIQVNMAALRELATEHAFLFADTAQLVLKAPDDCRAVITSRIAEHQAKVQREAEAAAERERARIRAEEEAKARAKAEQEQREREAAERRQREEADAAQRRQEREQQEAEARERAAATPAHIPQDAAAAPVQPSSVVPMPTRAPAVSAQPTLALGTIKEHLAPLTITAEGLRTLGFEAAGRQGAAVLYLDDELPYILTAAIQHLTKARDQLAKAA